MFLCFVFSAAPHFTVCAALSHKPKRKIVNEREKKKNTKKILFNFYLWADFYFHILIILVSIILFFRLPLFLHTKNHYFDGTLIIITMFSKNSFYILDFTNGMRISFQTIWLNWIYLAWNKKPRVLLFINRMTVAMMK